MTNDVTTISGGPARPFLLKAANNRRIDFHGEPTETLPEWGGVAEAEDVRFILHPPLDFEIAYRIPDYLVFAPYTRCVADLSLRDGPVRRKAWAAGSAFVCPPETCVRARVLEPVEFLVIAVSAPRAEALFERAAKNRMWAPDIIEQFVDPGFAALHQEARRSLLGDTLMEPAYLSALADAIFARIGCQYAGAGLGIQPKETLAQASLRRVVQRIETDLSDKITVKDLAQEVGLSRSHFSRAFQAVFGETPQQFIISRRLSCAREMLAEGRQSVAEIAAATGFSSQAHLSTAFKKRLGLTPARYRDAFRGQEQ